MKDISVDEENGDRGECATNRRWRLPRQERWWWTGPRPLWWPSCVCGETPSSARSGRGSGATQAGADVIFHLSNNLHRMLNWRHGYLLIWNRYPSAFQTSVGHCYTQTSPPGDQYSVILSFLHLLNRSVWQTWTSGSIVRESWGILWYIWGYAHLAFWLRLSAVTQIRHQRSQQSDSVCSHWFNT